MSVPSGTYAVQYRLWLYDETGETVDTLVRLEFPLADPTQTPYTAAQQAAELAAAEAAADAWRASMAAAYPGVAVRCSRTYLCRVTDDTWSVV